MAPNCPPLNSSQIPRLTGTPTVASETQPYPAHWHPTVASETQAIPSSLAPKLVASETQAINPAHWQPQLVGPSEPSPYPAHWPQLVASELSHTQLTGTQTVAILNPGITQLTGTQLSAI
ncbi:hypothetical protein DPMN_010324 [Dreissena polymorpha]|uniref:Uncharacterized protein n=1 Tax=Dreissena polymorpha TaxID=45954 RepID=A0A9D4S0V3_DREPO|nr:hypothetical protein DPMN_010324 [Dreissena polymorpha]